MFPKSLLVVSFSLILAAARPAIDSSPLFRSSSPNFHARNILARSIDPNSCNNPVSGLYPDDCRYLASAGFSAQGRNDHGPNGVAWIGNSGPNTVEMHNDAGVPLTVVLWQFPPGDYQSMCVNARQALITASIDPGRSITVSIENGVSGAFSGLYNRQTRIAGFGGVDNTWCEFTTGNWATIDVSREVNMSGNHVRIVVEQGNQAGCVSEYTTSSRRCVFECTDGTNSCQYNYDIINCDNGSQPGAQRGQSGGKADGGCSGWSNGGHLSVSFQG